MPNAETPQSARHGAAQGGPRAGSGSAAVPDIEGLDAWLAEREARWPDVREGTEARVVWADGCRQTAVSLVYLHGFSATRMETAPLADRVAAELGANLYYPRLTGHGRTPAAMGEARMSDWVDDAQHAFEVGRRLGERVVLIGTSTGATLATLLAATVDLPELAALVLVAPNFGPKDGRAGMLTWPGSRLWVPWIVGRERVVPPENDGHARYWTTTYPSTALIPMMELVRAVRRAPLERITQPVLAVFSDADEVVDARQTRPAIARMRRARVELEVVAVDAEDAALNPTAHVIAGDVFAPRGTASVVARIVSFLRDHGVLAGTAAQTAAEDAAEGTVGTAAELAAEEADQQAAADTTGVRSAPAPD